MRRILIIKPSSMGDVVHAFPAVHALLAADSSLTVDWVIHPAFAELLDYLPGIRKKILFRREELGRLSSFFPAAAAFLRELRKERYDAVIDLQGLFRSALIGLLARGKCLYGPRLAKEFPARFCYRKKLHTSKEIRHAVEKNCEMIRDFSGLDQVPPRYSLPRVEKYAEQAERLLASVGLTGKPFIAVAPGARWKTKQWPPRFFADCIGKMAQQMPEESFVLLGSPSEKKLGDAVEEAVDGKVPVLNLCGKTSTGELAELIRRADLLFCNDSGPMHLAAAAGTPVVALFGPTDPALTGPYSRESRVIRPELNCLGCLRKQCETEACHAAVSPRTVADRALELLRKGGVSK